MLITIPQVLAKAEVAECRAAIDGAGWSDGRLTAGSQSSAVKANEQLPDDDPAARIWSDRIVRALERHPLFLSAALPRHVFPPLFNRYRQGMGFGAHVDNAIRPLPRTGQRLRTDLSATLFLSEPTEYEGGELAIEDVYGVQGVKLEAGDMVLYPATSLHRVEPVRRGARTASFFWIQSLVKDDGARTILFDLDQSVQSLRARLGDTDDPAILRLTACYHNLIRRFAEI